jgi:hypothetical protein
MRSIRFLLLLILFAFLHSAEAQQRKEHTIGFPQRGATPASLQVQSFEIQRPADFAKAFSAIPKSPLRAAIGCRSGRIG